MLDVRRLVTLREVARCGSLAAAARALGYTQPAITHQIRQLEREAGTALVRRGGRGASLTEAGQVLVAHADAILARMAAAEEDVAAIAGLRAGRVRLASFPSGSACLVPQALARLRTAHPAVDVTLVEAEPPASVALLRQGECDLTLTFEYPGVAADDSADVVKVPLLADRLLAVLPDAHRLAGAGELRAAGAGELRLAELADETWIAGCERCRGHLVHACAVAGFTPRIAFATDDYVAVQQLVAAGLGIALLPELVTRVVRLPGVATLPLAGGPSRQIAVLAAAGERHPPAVAVLLGMLQAAAAELRQPSP